MYTRGQAIDFIEKVFGPGSMTNQGANISVVCPVCIESKGYHYAKRKLAIRTDNFVTHCWVCGYKSRNLANLIRKYHSGYFKEYVEHFIGAIHLKPEGNQEEELLRLPSGFRLLANQDMSSLFLETVSSLNYLSTRFGEDLRQSRNDKLWYWKFGISIEDAAFANRVIMPSFDTDGNLNYYTGRTILSHVRPKYLNPNVFREDVVFNEINIDWSEPLTIVEGPFDLIKCNANATCLLGSELTTEYKLFLMIIKHKTPVILALDSDAKEKALKIAQLLFEYDISVSILDIPPDFKDVGEMAQSEFTSLLKGATPFNADYFLRTRIAKLLDI